MWNERFSGEEYVYGTEPNDFLKENRDLFNTPDMPQKILCLGEGEGRNAVFLAQQGNQVWALDYAQAGLEKTRKLAELYTPEQLEYRTGGPGNVDMLVSKEELETAFASYSLLVSRECVRDIHEGKLHTGKGAVVQCIARKM